MAQIWPDFSLGNAGCFALTHLPHIETKAHRSRETRDLRAHLWQRRAVADADLIRRLKAARIERVLLELAPKHDVEVSLQLKSGAVARGRLLDARREGREGSLLLQSEGDELSYVELSAVEALTIKNASRYLDVLSFGAIEEPAASIAPSPLELDAAARAVGAKVGDQLSVEIAWDTFEATEVVRFALSEVLRSTGLAAEQLSEDAAGREQLASIRTIRLENGRAPSIVREGELLRVISALEKGREGRIDVIALLTAIGATTDD